jgi:hypothetical protein
MPNEPEDQQGWYLCDWCWKPQQLRHDDFQWQEQPLKFLVRRHPMQKCEQESPKKIREQQQQQRKDESKFDEKMQEPEKFVGRQLDGLC